MSSNNNSRSFDSKWNHIHRPILSFFLHRTHIAADITVINDGFIARCLFFHITTVTAAAVAVVDFDVEFSLHWHWHWVRFEIVIRFWLNGHGLFFVLKLPIEHITPECAYVKLWMITRKLIGRFARFKLNKTQITIWSVAITCIRVQRENLRTRR